MRVLSWNRIGFIFNLSSRRGEKDYMGLDLDLIKLWSNKILNKLNQFNQFKKIIFFPFFCFFFGINLG